jgi:hypothetical protein
MHKTPRHKPQRAASSGFSERELYVGTEARRAPSILEALVSEPSCVGAIETLSERHGHRIGRVAVDAQPRVLKWLPAEAATRPV